MALAGQSDTGQGLTWDPRMQTQGALLRSPIENEKTKNKNKPQKLTQHCKSTILQLKKKVYGWESVHSQPTSNTGDSIV